MAKKEESAKYFSQANLTHFVHYFVSKYDKSYCRKPVITEGRLV